MNGLIKGSVCLHAIVVLCSLKRQGPRVMECTHRQLRKVGTASEGLSSFLKDSVFIPSAEITAELEGERGNGPSAYTEHSCAQFKAATHIGTRREHYKCMGIVAGCCR